jgi:hypothetical protein
MWATGTVTARAVDMSVAQHADHGFTPAPVVYIQAIVHSYRENSLGHISVRLLEQICLHQAATQPRNLLLDASRQVILLPGVIVPPSGWAQPCSPKVGH